jgi:dynactin 1
LESTQAELQAAELQLDDLKQQLEVALGADEMLEMLTERTLTMGEVRSAMRATTAKQG